MGQREFNPGGSGASEAAWRLWMRAIRVHHWSKNALVFVPAVAAHALNDAAAWRSSVLAFLAFSLVASGSYLVNDILDRDADREHPTRRARPIASGALSISAARAGAAGLIAGGLAIGGLGVNWPFAGVLSGYLVVTLWYSLRLKQRPVIDILCLAGLYTGRILGGSAATGIEPSFWLLAFSMLLFFSLATAKRTTELSGVAARSEARAPGRGYEVGDLPLLIVFGVASAYASVLLLALYVNARAEVLYARPQLLWLLCPALLYWVSRIWFKTYRQELHDDPVVFALTDRPSLAVALISVVLVWLAV